MPRTNVQDNGPDPADTYAGERLKSRRLVMGLSQGALAKAVGLTFQQIQKYERGTNRMSVSRIQQFCKVLSVLPSFFFSEYGKAEGTPAAGMAGVADNSQDDFEHNSISERELIRLNKSYQRIQDPKIRKQVLKLIQSMADDAKKAS